MRKLTHGSIQSNLFSPKTRTIFSNFQKWTGEPYPPSRPTWLRTRLSVEEGSGGQRGTEPSIRTVYKWFVARSKNSYRVKNGEA